MQLNVFENTGAVFYIRGRVVGFQWHIWYFNIEYIMNDSDISDLFTPSSKYD